MTAIDRERWDAKYSDQTLPGEIAPPEWLLRQAAKLKPGRALDLACGEGHAAIWLAKQGWSVTGIDISPVGLEIAKKLARDNGVVVKWIVDDLDDCWLGVEQYDLITVFRFLDRRLPARIEAALRPGGRLIYETFLAPANGAVVFPPRNPAFTLQPGELLGMFPGLEVLDCKEGKLGGERMARLCARKK